MARTARIVVPGLPHHITQRGNNREDVFFVDEDRRVYLELLRAQGERYGLTVLGYCLMANHTHLIAIPRSESSLAEAVGRTHFLYTQYINRLHGRSGHLWQNRFFSCALGETHKWNALRYVERHPVRAKLVRVAWRYPWSSAAAHVGEGVDASGLLDLRDWRKAWKLSRWKEALREREDEELVKRLQLGTRTGRPLATDRLLAKLETRLNRRLRARPRGRPKKTKDVTRAAPKRRISKKKTKGKKKG